MEVFDLSLRRQVLSKAACKTCHLPERARLTELAAKIPVGGGQALWLSERAGILNCGYTIWPALTLTCSQLRRSPAMIVSKRWLSKG